MPTIVEALNAGRDDDAAALCAVELVIDPRNAALNELAAIAALRRGRAGEARAFALASLETRPGHVATLIVSGRASPDPARMPAGAHFIARPCSGEDILDQLRRLMPC